MSTVEQVPSDEAARTQDIIQTAVRIVDQHREGTRYLRDAHAKAHGCVNAEVQVLDGLGSDLRQGVFTTEIYTLSLHDALPICARACSPNRARPGRR